MSNLLLWEVQYDIILFCLFYFFFKKSDGPTKFTLCLNKGCEEQFEKHTFSSLVFRAWPINCKVPVDTSRTSQTFQPPPEAEDNHRCVSPVA